MATELTSSKTHEVEEVEAEELDLQVNQQLHVCSNEDLIFLAKGLTIPRTEIEGISHLSLIKHVSKFVESMRGLSLGDEVKSVEHLYKILETIESLRSTFRGTLPKHEEVSTVAAKEEESTPADKKPQPTTRRKENTPTTSDLADAAGKAYISTLFREFKILGSIGKANEKDKLTFGGLSLQIKQAEAKRVNEGEIVLAVIRAMSPSLNLRRMLEVMGDSMSLNKLKSLLRAHFEEPRALDIHKELQNLCQRPGEGTVEFIFRAHELAARLQMASEDEGEEGSLSFSPTQIKRILHESIDSGIQDETVRKELRKILAIPDIEIDEISIKLQSVLLLEKNRNEKLGKIEKEVKEKRIGGAKSITSQDKTMAETLKTLQCQVAAITKLQTDMENLRTTMDNHQKGQNSKQNSRKGKGQRPICEKCKAENVERCIHCMNCGGEFHIARNCFAPRKQGNC